LGHEPTGEPTDQRRRRVTADGFEPVTAVDDASIGPAGLDRIPPIVDLDAHVVEPPTMWSDPTGEHGTTAPAPGASRFRTILLAQRPRSSTNES
jgi:hypothetical protein